MSENKIRLDDIKIASPCAVPWASMTGDERVRDCSQCRMRVYNLSEMTRPEAERLIEEKEGRLCVRFYRRADGTILTQDCPVGLRAVRLKLLRLTGAVFAMAGFLAAGLGLRRRDAQPLERPRTLMGEISAPHALGRATAGKPTMGAPRPARPSSDH